MHDECMVGIGGIPLYYQRDRDVLPGAILHSSVYERLEMDNVRNFTSYGAYRPAPLRNHEKAKRFFPPPSSSDEAPMIERLLKKYMPWYRKQTDPQMDITADRHARG
jgi:hypothetical protein